MIDGLWRLGVRVKARVTPKWVIYTVGGSGDSHRPGRQQRTHLVSLVWDMLNVRYLGVAPVETSKRQFLLPIASVSWWCVVASRRKGLPCILCPYLPIRPPEQGCFCSESQSLMGISSFRKGSYLILLFHSGSEPLGGDQESLLSPPQVNTQHVFPLPSLRMLKSLCPWIRQDTHLSTSGCG